MIRRSLLALALLGCGAWAAGGWKWAHALAAALQPKDRAEQMVAELEARDPEAAQALRKSRSGALPGAWETAVLASGFADRAALQSLAKDAERGVPWQVKLAGLALKPDLHGATEDRERFLAAHGATLEALADIPGAGQYWQLLENAAADPATWEAIHDDPIGLLVWANVEDPELRAYYRQERAWLAEPLAAACDGAPESLRKLLGLARQYHPWLREGFAAGLGTPLFALFEKFGDQIAEAVGQRRLPLVETLEIAYANMDWLAGRTPAEFADLLAATQAQRPQVWRFAGHAPFALRLAHDAPAEAERLLLAYGADDIAAFVYANYPNQAAAAAQAIDRFKDPALYVLQKYKDEPRAKALLGDATVGPRLVPYLLKFEDAGLDRVAENRAWLDKYFDADGNPRDKEWWTLLPGGGFADVVRSKAKGQPCEWGELGWAAFDVADAALMVATFGGSKAVTAPVVAGAKAGARSVGREAASAAWRAGKATSFLRRAGQAGHVFAAGGRVALKGAARSAELLGAAAKRFATLPVRAQRVALWGLHAANLWVKLEQGNFLERFQQNLAELAGKPLAFAGDAVRNALSSVLGVRPDRLAGGAALGLYGCVWLALLGAALLFRLPLRPGRSLLVRNGLAALPVAAGVAGALAFSPDADYARQQALLASPHASAYEKLVGVQDPRLAGAKDGLADQAFAAFRQARPATEDEALRHAGRLEDLRLAAPKAKRDAIAAAEGEARRQAEDFALARLRLSRQARDPSLARQTRDFLGHYASSAHAEELRQGLAEAEAADLRDARLAVRRIGVVDAEGLKHKAEAARQFLDRFGLKVAAAEAESIRRAIALAERFAAPREYTVSLERAGGFASARWQRVELTVGAQPTLAWESDAAVATSHPGKQWSFQWSAGEPIEMVLKARTANPLSRSYHETATRSSAGPLALRALAAGATLTAHPDWADEFVGKTPALQTSVQGFKADDWELVRDYLLPGSAW